MSDYGIIDKRDLVKMTGVPASVGVCEPIEGFAERPDFILGCMKEMADELIAARDEAERLRARVAELVEYVDGPGELAGDYNWERLKDDTNTSQAWLLRKQAEAVEAEAKELMPGPCWQPDDPAPEYTAACEVCADFKDYAQRLRQQADEAEKAGG